MTQSAVIDDPEMVINTLAARVRELESALARQKAEYRAALPEQAVGILRWMRARSVIPLYVGPAPDEKAKSNFVGDKGCPLMTDEMATKLLGEVWFLDDAPMTEEVKDAIRKAAQHGMGRW